MLFGAILWGGLRCNIRTPSIARWKVRDRLPIHHNRTCFAVSYGWNVISENLSKSAFFERVAGSLWVQISDGRGVAHQPLLLSEKQSDYPFMWCQSIRSTLCSLPQSTRVTDRQTDGQTNRQNYDSQDRAA